MIAFILFSCQNKPQKLELKTFQYEKKYSFNDTLDFDSLKFSAEIELPIHNVNREVVRNLRKQIVGKMFGELFNAVPIDSVLPLYGRKLFQDCQRNNLFYSTILDTIKTEKKKISNELSVQGMVMYFDENVLSYSYERYATLSNEKGFITQFVYNFNLNTSEPIKEKDLFKKGYEESLIQLIKEQIIEEYVQIESVADLYEFNYYADKIEPNENFYITKEGLVYVYNPYDIAFYSVEQIEVLLSYEQLKPIMKKNNILHYLYTKK